MAAKFELGFVIDRDSALSLQHQLRLRLIEAMNRGVLRPGRKLPSSRELAGQIGIARNTVTLAYEALVAEGHLVSRPRSGIFVADELPGERVTTGRRGLAPRSRAAVALAASLSEPVVFQEPPNWEQHPYPFLDGCLDSSLAPFDEWRESLRLAFSRQGLARWNAGTLAQDDPQFLNQLRSTVLPSWGISAGPDEVLAAACARHALFLTVHALTQRNGAVVLDAAIEPEIRMALLDRGVSIYSFAERAEGVATLRTAPQGSLMIVCAQSAHDHGAHPAHSNLALLEAAATREAMVIEYAATSDLRETLTAALRSRDQEGRVALVGGLAAAATLGQPPGFVCADAAVIERIRQIRSRIGSEFSSGLQRAWSYYLALGHYTARLSRAQRILQARRIALRDALQHYLHKFVEIESIAGSSAYRVIGPSGMNALELARAAAEMGVLIEPESTSRPNVFRMGVTSLPKERIRVGVEVLARLIRGDRKLGSRRIEDEIAAPLSGRALRRALSGSTWLYNTVYGEPCTIELRSDGVLVGRAGYANDDCDVGRWWIENDRWHRQWEHWAYAEVNAYTITIDGDQVRLFNGEGLLVDTSVIVRSAARGRERREQGK